MSFFIHYMYRYMHFFTCSHFRAIRAQCLYSDLLQDAEGSMRLFMWHNDHEDISHCLTAILVDLQHEESFPKAKPFCDWPRHEDRAVLISQAGCMDLARSLPLSVSLYDHTDQTFEDVSHSMGDTAVSRTVEAELPCFLSEGGSFRDDRVILSGQS